MPDEQYVPKSVQDAADRADAILKDRNTDPNKPVETPAVVTEPAPEPETIESLKAEIQRLKHSQEVLQGKYDKEIKALGDNPKLLQGLREMNRKLMSTNETLTRTNSEILAEVKDLRAQLAAKPAQPAEPAKPQEVDPSKVFSEEELTALREDGLSEVSIQVLAKRTMQQGPPAEIQELRNRLAKSEEHIAQNEQEKFDLAIQSVHPEWDNGLNSAINQSEDFSEFLGPKNSIKRRIINAAYADRDVQAVCDFLQEFKDWKGFKKPKVEPDPKPKPKTDKLLETQPTGSDPVIDLSKTPDGKRIYTTDFIRQFYKAQQVYSANGQGIQAVPELGLTKEQAAEINNDLNLAGPEGRVRP